MYKPEVGVVISTFVQRLWGDGSVYGNWCELYGGIRQRENDVRTKGGGTSAESGLFGLSIYY
jgi:hypothetical protein